ncbi:hypothetical protein CAEBREN_09190 [Caenorhabditis brenneri]|uniref:Uncharacterized protein n=1 Tax=Caenorhabditis brenneri TaxID=135651 RepID=G0NWF0_CAEBE|nr:hypothetical protein CAEBREN_09190 [Caenorhabditis brenneri]
MIENQMSYPSLRILLEHLEANKRIELVQCCPSLKHVDRAVPISIRNLYLGGSQVSINSIIYTIGVIRQYPKDGPKILKAYQRCNDSNGAAYDLNQYGRLDRSANQVVNAGEIAIPTAHNPVVERNDEEEDIHMEQEKARLAQLKGLKRMKKRQLEIEKIEASLYEWNLRKENSHPPYSMYLQYTRVNADKTKIKERLEYNQKLHEAAKYMFDVLFSGRKDPIRVDCLLISASGGVLRVPESLKIKARKLATGYNFTPIMKSIWNLLVNRSFEEVSVISGTRITHIYNNQVINSAKVFRIMKTPVNGNLFQIILNSKNPHVHVSKGKITRDEYLTLFDRLRISNRPVGTAYSFGVHSKDRLKKFFEALKQRRGVRTEYLLENDCAPTKNYNAKTRYLEPWILWFQIFQTVKFIKKGVARKKEDLVCQIDEIISTKKEIGTTECMQVQSKKVVKEVLNEIQKRDGATSRREEKRGCTRFPLTYKENLYIEQVKARLAQLKRLRRMKKRQQEKERLEALLYAWNLRKENRVLRLPKNFKVKVRKLCTGLNFAPTMKSIGKLLVDRSIRDISVIGGFELRTTYNSNSIIKSADSFTIFDTPVTGNDFQVVLKNRNQKLYVSKGKIRKDEYLTLFDKMKTIKRKIGTEYSFGVHSKKLLKSFFDALKQREGVVPTRIAWKKQGDRFPFSYRARKNKESTISVFCFRNTTYDEKTRKIEPWTLRFQIMKTVKVVKKNDETKKKDVMKLIDKTIKANKVIGTCDSMEVNSKKVVREVLDEIQKRDGATFKKEEKRGCTRFPFTYSLPIDNSSKLVIFCNRNKNLNKKGTKHKPWTLWFFVEKINEMSIEDYKKFLDKIIKWRIIATYPVCINTKNHVKKLIDEFKSRDGVTVRNLRNKG